MRLLSVPILSVALVALCMGEGFCQIPQKNVSAASARLVARGFKNVESLKENKTEAGFVNYIELTSNPVPFDAEILKGLTALYKPETYPVDVPPLPPVSAIVLFDGARKPAVILWIFTDNRIGIARPFEVDENCYQGIRDDVKGCTVQDTDIAQWLRAFVEKHQSLPVDISDWKQEKKR